MTIAPACCAGLRQALLHDWQHDFPLHESPFQLVARQMGAGVREVLHHCQALHEEGALQAIRLNWSPRMQALRWRIVHRLRGPLQPTLEAALRALPGVAEVLIGEPLAAAARCEGDGAAWLWFDVVAHRLADAQRQRAAFEAAAGCPVDGCLALEPDPRSPCAPTPDAPAGCPCEDEPLAEQAEEPLPLVTHPYRPLALALGRTEREVISALRRWRNGGYLTGAGFVRADAPMHTLGLAALLARHPGDDDLPARLLARPGIAEVQRFSADEARAWLVTASGAPQQAAHTLERALAACVVPAPHRLLSVRKVRLRHAPLLFSNTAA
jgi:DNA-binding Lrp family transcriptional regulator